MRPFDFLFLVVICLVWGVTFVVGKAALDEFPPLLFTGLRYLLLSVLLMPLLRIYPGQMVNVALCALTLGGMHFALFYMALSFANNIAAVSVAVQVGTPISVIMAMIVLGERIGIYRLIGMAAAFGGVMVLSFDPAMFTEPLALYLVIGSAFIGSIGGVVMRRMQSVSTFGLQAWIAVASWPVLFSLSWLLEDNQFTYIAEAGWLGWGGVIYTSLGASLIGHAGMFYLLKRYELSLISPLTLMAPIFGGITAVLVRGDTVTSALLLGGSITLAGVLLINIREPRTTPAAPVPLARRA